MLHTSSKVPDRSLVSSPVFSTPGRVSKAKFWQQLLRIQNKLPP